MTIRVTKTRLAAAIAALIMLVPAVATAASVFTDVPDGAFYTDSVEWAADNGITTGTTATTFSPEDSVTRGQMVTFLKRYNDNVVEPAQQTVYWAWVNNLGSVYSNSSSDGVTATRTATGNFVVTFPTDVADCSWATSQRSVDGLFFVIDPDYTSQAFMRLSTRSTGFFPNLQYFNEDIRVSVTDGAGDAKNTDFNITVTCPA